ncbi:MAG: hypothetical protein AAB484_02075 [Patescibacteria group bacterium]
MKKSISISLARIFYRGQSIGRDIKIEIKIFERRFQIEKRILMGEIKEIHQHLNTFNFDKDTVDSEVAITVTEKDLLFSDSNTIKTSIHIDTTSKEIQEFAFIVKVGERRSLWKRILWGSREAIFEVYLEAKVQDEAIVIKKYSYRSVNEDEDYNRYDDLIGEIVDYWNEEFSKEADTPPEFLDPNLVKAIMYQETRVGHDERKNGFVDVMQVGYPGDPALPTLRGEFPEYWIHNGKEIPLKYDARIESVRDSIMWGVRWLYHKAQEIKISDGRRHWLTWKEAVSGYGPPTDEYDRDVWSIYKNGIKKERKNTIQLWSIVILVPLLAISFLSNKSSDLRSSIWNSLDTYQKTRVEDMVEDIEIEHSQVKPSLFAAVIVRDLDWWEDLKLGTWDGGRLKWLKIEEEPTEQSILSFRFIKLTGFTNPLLEVYGSTHVGNGNLYLYEIKGKTAHLIFKERAVDSYPDGRQSKEDFEKYGYYGCGEIYRGGKLAVIYEINPDRTVKVKLSGIQDVYCEDGRDDPDTFYYESSEIKVAEIPIEKQFILK